MEYKTLGNSDLKLSEITFGAWAVGGWMWGGNDMNESIKAIRKSIDQGVTSIDTAPVYGMGLSEEIVAEAIKGYKRSDLQIVTKFGLRWNDTKGQFYFKSHHNGKDLDIYKYAAKESVIAECEESLKRLKTDYIDLYQIHWADETTPIEETMEALVLLKKQGKIREAGVCNYTKQQMETAEKVINLVSNQVSYSMLKREIEQELVPHCIKFNKSILAYSPLQRGFLSGKIKPGHVFAEGDHRSTSSFAKDENLKAINTFLSAIKPLAESKNATLSQLVIRWTLQQPGITIALVGARNAQQAEENAKAGQLKLSDEEMMYINKALNGLKLT